MENVPSLQDLRDAHERIKPFVHRTPVFHSELIDQAAGTSVFFKCENLQKVGAFKMRGATNAVLCLSDAQRSSGVATHSSGNHAQALAKAAKIVGCQAFIVMPETAPKVKVNAVKAYGAEIIFCAPTLQAREDTLKEVQERTGAAFIHPFDDYRVIAGQATAALELMEEIKDLDIFMTPVGGGGLLAGTALAVHYLQPQSQVMAGEPSGADDAYRSLQTGEIQPSVNPDTIADGLLTSLSTKTFGIIKQYVSRIITVDDQEIKQAMRLLWERMKIVVEPSGAVPLAAVLQQPQLFAGKPIGIIISGGNVDLDQFSFR
ncbi:MAG: pyridoxal-phosphate dependent enzyme [Cyclobacteriaceae bacterium]|nr:pyridoxal-phosphate dependent enzyme [Cyclobacteriaceae bacterium]